MRTTDRRYSEKGKVSFLFFHLMIAIVFFLNGCGNGDGNNGGGGQAFNLTLVKTGNGKGTVTSTPSGIDCGAICIASFASGTSVTLTAAPDIGSIFQGWSGECTGTTTCVVTVDADKTVTATFDPPPPTTSGGLATINTGKTVFGFIPNGTDVLAVPLAGIGASKPAIEEPVSKPSATTSLSFIVDSCAADGVDLKIVCVGFNSSKIAVLDLKGFIASGTAPTAIEFDPGNTIRRTFSGGGCLNCGVISDAGDHRFIVSSGDGYRVFDYTGVLLKPYLSNRSATPPIDLTTENFGYDPIQNQIISPEYGTNNNFLWVVDLNKDKTYRWTKRMVSALTDPANGLTELPGSILADAATIDPLTGILTIGNEGIPLLLTINMSASSFDDTAGTFTAPYSVKILENVLLPRTTGMAVEPSSHLLFLEEEFSNVIGLVVLPTSTSSGSAVINEYTSATIPSPSATCTGVSRWNNVGDPHGLALFTSVVDGKPMGLLINNVKSCAAIVDLNAFRAAPKTTGTNRVDPTYDLLTNNVIKFVSLK